MSRGQAVIKDIRFYSTAILLTQIVTVAASLLSRKFLGPTQMGVWVFLQVIVGYAEYLALGTIAAAGYEIPLYNGRGDAAKSRRVADAAFSFGLITSLLASAGIVAYALLKKESLREELFYGFLAGAAFVVLQRFSGLLITIVRAEKQFALAGRQMLYSSILNAVLIAFFSHQFKIYGFLAAMALSLVFNSAYLLWKSGIRFRFTMDPAQIRELVSYGFPLMLVGLVLAFYETMDRLFITRFLGFETLGHYSIALMTINYLNGVPNSVGIVTVSHLQEKYGQTQDPATLRGYLKKVDAGYGILMTVLIGGAWFGMPWLVRFFLPDFNSGIPAMRILALSAYFAAMTQGYTQLIYVIRRHHALLWLTLAATTFSALAIAFAVGARLGLEGVAGATALSAFVYFSIIFFFASLQIETLGRALKRYAHIAGLFLWMLFLLAWLQFWVHWFGPLLDPWVQIALYLLLLTPSLRKSEKEFGLKERILSKFKKGGPA